MEKFQEALQKSKKSLQIADHMLFVTYPLVKDPKLLLAIMENIFLALTNSMGAILYHERLFKHIPPFHDNFESKFYMFQEKVVDKHKIDRSFVLIINEIKELVVEHKKSPIEFSRKDSFVICSEDYNMKTISTDKLKQYIFKTKLFVQKANEITSQYGRLFR